MRACRVHRRVVSWVAALALLMAALAPALSHALAAATGGGWIEICTTQGAKWVKAGDDGTDPASPSVHVADHCPYCSLHAPTLGLPPATDLSHLPLPLRLEVPLAFLAAPRTLHAWLQAQPRAPPLLA